MEKADFSHYDLFIILKLLNYMNILPIKKKSDYGGAKKITNKIRL